MPAVSVVYPELGYSVRIPGKDWVYEKYHTPKGSKDVFDLIMGHPPKMTLIVVQTYWDGREGERVSIFDTVNGRRHRLSNNGFDVGPKDYRVDDKGYFMEFEAVRTIPDGATRRYWIVGGRLHRLPGAIVLVSGNALDGHEDFMRENLDKVIRSIQPYRSK